MRNNYHKEFVAYTGCKFTIEWYFNDKGNSSALNDFEMMSEAEQIKLLGLFELIGNVGEIKNETKFRYEHDKIYAFKLQRFRFLCFFFAGHKIIVTNAFKKKTNKLPANEKKRALHMMHDYMKRMRQGDYYE